MPPGEPPPGAPLSFPLYLLAPDLITLVPQIVCRTVLLNRHYNKNARSKAIHRVGRSVAIGAVARVVLACVRDDQDETGERRLFGVAKSNLIPESEKASMAYRIVTAHVPAPATGIPIETSR